MGVDEQGILWVADDVQPGVLAGSAVTGFHLKNKRLTDTDNSGSSSKGRSPCPLYVLHDVMSPGWGSGSSRIACVRSSVRISTETSAILTEGFSGCPRSVQILG
jgi:hypothetical protein